MQSMLARFGYVGSTGRFCEAHRIHRMKATMGIKRGAKRTSAAPVPSTTREEKQGLSGSLLRGIDILRAFRPGFGYLGNSELTAATGLPKATVSRITGALLENGYLQFDPITSKYSLTARVLTIGYGLLSNTKVIQIAHDYMQPLATQLGCSVSLAAPDAVDMIYLHRCSSEARPFFLSAGSTVEMARTASGRAYLSALGEEERAIKMARLAKEYPGDWSHIQQGIRAAIREVRERAFCSANQTWNKNIRAIAAPLISKNGRNILTLNCVAPVYAVEQSEMEKSWAPRLLYAVQQISDRF